MLRFRTLVLGCALLFPVRAAAQVQTLVPPSPSPSHLAAARELVDVVRLVEVAAVGVNVSIDEQIRGNPAMEPYRTTMKEWGSALFATDEAKNAFAGLYASTFTEAELRQLVAFYRTPLGQKLAGSQTTLTVRGAEIGRSLAQAHQADLVARIQALTPKP
jgi:hypothetical protein